MTRSKWGTKYFPRERSHLGMDRGGPRKKAQHILNAWKMLLNAYTLPVFLYRRNLSRIYGIFRIFPSSRMSKNHYSGNRMSSKKSKL